MTAHRKGIFRVGTALAVAALMAAATMIPVAAAQDDSSGPIVDISNPAMGDYLPRGKLLIMGDACDPKAAPGSGVAGTGIRKVSAYFGDRDTTEGIPSWRPGGYLTAATVLNNQPSSTLGLPTTSPKCKMANAGFQLLTPTLRKGTWNLNIYVLSTSGKETHLVIQGLRVQKP